MNLSIKKYIPGILVITILFHSSLTRGSDSEQDVLNKVLKDFIRIKGMKMHDYSQWWSPSSLDECAEKCISSRTIFCRSFSYSRQAEACSTYAKARDDGAENYGKPNAQSSKNAHLYWEYFERKSEKYKRMENELDRLQNLTVISMAEATTVLSSLSSFIQPNVMLMNTTAAGNDSAVGMGILPSELDIAGQSMLLVMNLNPVSSSPSINGLKDFTDIVANISSVMSSTAYASAWQVVQKNPASAGSSAIVMSAEKLSREVSMKLFATQDAAESITAETESIGFWIDVEPKENANENANFQISENFNDLVERFDGNFDMFSQYYTFPNRDVTTEKEVTRAPYEAMTTGIPQQKEKEVDFFQDIITLPRAALGRKSVVTNVRYKTLDQAMPVRKLNDKYLPKRATIRYSAVNSAVLTLSVYPPPQKSVLENDPVRIIFKHHRRARGNLEEYKNLTYSSNETTQAPNDTSEIYSEENAYCVFWKEGRRENDGGSWSTDGCVTVASNLTHTICSCTHLTSFAILLQIVDYDMEEELSEIHLTVLKIISKVGCILSLIGVTIMCAAFLKLKFHTENMKIHFNLGVAVGLADLVFVFEELAENTRGGCIMVTILLYYFNMTVLAWMLIEGVHLYSQVVVVFVSARRWAKYYYGAGWGVPLFIMAISMGILNVELGTNGVCWLSPADNSIWAFAAPALLVILINTVILIAVVKVIINIQPGKSNSVKAAKIRNAVKGSIFLFPLLGTTWLFGLLSLSQETLLFQYVFATTNSLQGFFLFVFHCLCNSEVREDARRHKWFGAGKSPISIGSPPPQSSLFNLSVSNGLRRFRNSISFDMPSSSASESEGQGGDDSDFKNGKLGKILTKFPRIFTMKLPETIKEEKEDQYGKDADTSVPSSPNELRVSSGLITNTQTSEKKTEGQEKTLQLPGMPIKNDKIILPREAQLKLDRMLEDEMAKNAARELQENDIIISEDLKKDLFDEFDEKKKMQMSYDSGLNSIDNESIFDEDDDEWMAKQEQQLKQQQQLKNEINK